MAQHCPNRRHGTEYHLNGLCGGDTSAFIQAYLVGIGSSTSGSLAVEFSDEGPVRCSAGELDLDRPRAQTTSWCHVVGETSNAVTQNRVHSGRQRGRERCIGIGSYGNEHSIISTHGLTERQPSFSAQPHTIEHLSVEGEVESDRPTVTGGRIAHGYIHALGHEGVIINGKPGRKTDKAQGRTCPSHGLPGSNGLRERVRRYLSYRTGRQYVDEGTTDGSKERTEAHA